MFQSDVSFPQLEMTTVQLVVQPVVSFPQPVMTTAAPVVHTIPYTNEPVYHVEPAESFGIFDRMDEFQDQFQ